MAQSAGAPADGTTFSFGGTTIGEITSISTSAERAAIDVTHLTSTSREFVAGIPDAGTIDLEFNFIGESDHEQDTLIDSTTGLQTAAATLNAAGGFAACIISWQNQHANAYTWTVDGFVTNFGVSGSEGDKITGTCTIKLSDATDPPITIAGGT